MNLVGIVVRSIESGKLPDLVTRAGIRQLLRQRLRQMKARRENFSLGEFIRATWSQPVAVSPEKANEQHYEVPSEFYRNVLGRRLKYSCCYWSPTTKTLDEAEEEALRITCENAQLKDGMDVLELGCGWGSLSIWMAQEFPRSQITAVSNSNTQREFIEMRASELGISNLTVITADMNTFAPDSRFDRVVSVEMFEHMRNHQRLMNRIYDWLRPTGKLFVHVFCHKDTPYIFRSAGDLNWMGRYFFSGGMMPSANLLPSCGSRLSLAKQCTWNGSHYAKTCRAWLQNQDANAGAIVDVLKSTYGDGARLWHNRWRLFFMACEELFAFQHGEEWFVVHYLFERC
ncbi:MAG: class I SAM-dependent methyltransferase [Planctomycetales bacterium]|nr:class I SAM-dependent methyltransferase [Planctomycetales bacterium]